MDPLLIPVFALLIPIVIAPTAMAFKKAERDRQLEHAERMRALELGRVLPKDESWLSPIRIGFAIGAVVPIAALSAGAAANEAAGFHETIWMACAMIGTAGVICGSILVGKSLCTTTQPAPTEKAQYDPDAYDVVGRRG